MTIRLATPAPRKTHAAIGEAPWTCSELEVPGEAERTDEQPAAPQAWPGGWAR